MLFDFSVYLSYLGWRINFQQMEKSVEQKVRECRELIVQNMERTLQHKMVYMFLKDHKKDGEVKQFSVNGKDGIIKMEFSDHEKALAFYKDYNFSEKILIRPFNIYFNLTLTEPEMKKFYFEGITEENQRSLFEACCNKIGICKLYTSYSSGPRGKLKPNGVLSFIRREPIPEPEFKALSEALKNMGVKISNYVHDKGLKCSINITNFIQADYNTDESVIQADAEKEVRRLIKEMTKEPESGLTVIVKKKELRDPKEAEPKREGRVVVTALVEYADVPKTMEVFEQMREHLVDRGSAKAVLYFHNEENNSFLSLFTMGLGKPGDLTEKQFENKLLQDFREINKNVIQVNVFHVKYNDSYVGRVYLRTEQDGKDFLVDYPTKRAVIYKDYKETKAPITFNINVDVKTLRKIKQAERKARETEERIKKQSEANRRENMRRPGYPMPNMPIPITGPAIVGPNSMGAPPIQGGVGLPFPGTGPMGNKIQMPFPGGPVGAPNQPGPAHDPRTKIRNILKDRSNFENNIDLTTVKRVVHEPLKFCLEETGLPPAEASTIASKCAATQT